MMAERLELKRRWICGINSCAIGAFSFQPVRILIVTLLEGSCAVMASKISNSRLDFVISAEPQPRLHTRSIGHAEFRS
jgi:hypothetical protein